MQQNVERANDRGIFTAHERGNAQERNVHGAQDLLHLKGRHQLKKKIRFMNISRGWVNPTLNSGENKAYFFHFIFKRKFPFEYFP